MDKDLQKMYSKMTRAEAKKEVALLKKELSPLYKQIIRLEACLEYLDYKIVD